MGLNPQCVYFGAPPIIYWITVNFKHVIQDKNNFRFGRRALFVGGMILSSIAGLARAFTNSYTCFAILEFFEAGFGSAIYSCGFILGKYLDIYLGIQDSVRKLSVIYQYEV